MKNLKITIWSDLWPNSGLGSSASTSIAFVKAFREFFSFTWNNDKINELGFQMEKMVHGTPSGIDNSVCTYEGIIQYKLNNITKILFSGEILLLLVDSGEKRDTGIIVEEIRSLREKNPVEVDRIFNSIENITRKSIKYLHDGNMEEIGKLMSENHRHLKKLKLSSPNIDKILDIAQKYNILGSKLTGAGRGGAVLVLGSLDVLNELKSHYGRKNFKSTLVKISIGKGD